MSDEQKNDLDTLFPGVDVPVRLRGSKAPEMVRVEPLYAAQFREALQKAKPLAQAISGVLSFEGGEVRVKIDGGIKEFIESLLTSADDALGAFIGLLAVALDKPAEWFDDVPMDHLFDLGEAVLGQNRDFFNRRILPLLQAWVPAAAPQQAAGGEQSLPASAQPDTQGQKSTE